MENLMDLYNSVQNPLDDLDKVKKIIEVYSKSDKDGKDFYKNLVYASDKKYYDGFVPQYVDRLNSLLFNLWKNNIVNMNEDEYNTLYSIKGNYQDNDFQNLRKKLSLIPDVSTEEEIEKIKNQLRADPKCSEAYLKYKYTVNHGSLFDKWIYVDSAKLGQRPTSKIQHRLYLNVGSLYKENMVLFFLLEADRRNLEYTLKYSEGGYRDDTIVIYANDTNILQYIEILRDFREKYPIFNSEVYSPPIMTGTIDGWIGYGAEPTNMINNKQQSYTTLREKIIKEAISRVYSDWLSSHGGIKNLSEYEVAEKDPGFVQAVRDEIKRISKEYEIDENNFCFDIKTVEQMKQDDSKSKPYYQQQLSNILIKGNKDARGLVAEGFPKPSMDWEDLLEKDNQEPDSSQNSSIDENHDIELVHKAINRLKGISEKQNAQNQRIIKKKVGTGDKDYYKDEHQFVRESKQASASKSTIEDDEERKIKLVLEEMNRIKEYYDNLEAQKRRKIKKKVGRCNKGNNKNPESYLRKSIQVSAPIFSIKTDDNQEIENCLRELQRLTPEGRKRGNQYLSTLEQKNHERGND